VFSKQGEVVVKETQVAYYRKHKVNETRKTMASEMCQCSNTAITFYYR
jgi:hypothetical protein